MVLVGVVILVFIFAVVYPFWCMVDCALNDEIVRTNKAIWIIFMLLLWPVGGVFYRLFATRSGTLRSATIISILPVILLIGFIIYSAVFSPAPAKKANPKTAKPKTTVTRKQQRQKPKPKPQTIKKSSLNPYRQPL